MASYKSMDAKHVRELYDRYSTLLLLGVPRGTQFGIDMRSWEVGPKFKGVKLIPPGIHYIYYSAVSKQGEVAPRTGFFHNFKPKEVILRNWDVVNEEIQSEECNPELLLQYSQNLKEMDEFLGAYPHENYKKWVSLTENITVELLLKQEPEKKFIQSATQLVPQAFKSNKDNRACQQMDASCSNSKEASKENNEECSLELPEMDCMPGTTIRFTQLPTKRYPSSCSAAEITKYGMDSSFMLTALLDTYDTTMDVLGELQLAFVCFLVANVYDAFEQWKKLVRLLCTCDEALEKYPELYTKFLTTLYHQIQEVPRDFFVDIVSSDNFLTNTLQVFFENVKCSSASENFKMRAKKFQEHLTKRFSWNFDEEPDDCAPVIVENVEI